MRKVLRSGFDRQYVLLPLLVAITLVASLYFFQKARREVTLNLTITLRDREDRMRQIAELIYASLESESAQRGFLITGQEAYLEPYAAGRKSTTELLEKLIPRYEQRDQQEVATLQRVQVMLAPKYEEMDRTIALQQAGDRSAALRVMSSAVGLRTMGQIRSNLEALRTRERARIYDGITEWNNQVRIHNMLNLGSMIFTMVLLLVVGLLATREIRRRDLATRELEEEVQLRTAELRDLSEHMLRISELEKSSLARELHDELGGLLVAMRMDFSQLKRKVQLPDAAAEERWARIDAGLKAGVELKRRVIEELRPTLLDNMGLVVALRWQAEQSCQQANIKLTTHLPETEPELENEAAIAVFRTVQESLSNVLKHARATEVRLFMVISGDQAVITVEDNGVGLPEGAAARAGSHGLKQMKFRMQAIHGSCETENGPMRGTVTTIRFAIAQKRAPVGIWEPA
jgi:signal transduction histidine kinase